MGLRARLASGPIRPLIRPWTNLPCQPTHLEFPPPVSPATSRYVKSTVGPVFESNLAKLLSAQRDQSSRHLIDLLQPSMNRIAFQRFLTMSEMKSFKVSFVSITVTSWSFIEFLFLTFHIAHIIMVIKMRILSESFKLCSSILETKDTHSGSTPIISTKLQSHRTSTVCYLLGW